MREHCNDEQFQFEKVMQCWKVVSFEIAMQSWNSTGDVTAMSGNYLTVFVINYETRSKYL